MPLKCEEYNNVCVVALGGDLSGEVPAELKKLVDQRMENAQTGSFVVDFEKAGFVDSEGLEALLWLRRRCEDRFGQVKLINLDENCRKILEVTRLEHRFECHNDLAGALKTMR